MSDPITTGTTFARPGAGPIERAAREFTRALTDGDSVFTPGQPIWTSEHAAELLEDFAGRIDIGGSSFDEKLARQLADVSPGASQLFAELYCLDLLPLSDYKGSTKRACIRVPLSIGGLEIALPAPIDEALDHGVMNGGVAFKTRRFWQLSYLVEFVVGFLALPSDERRALAGDPLAFRNHLDSVTTVNAPSQRNALLYLLFPGFFLPIAKADHRSLIRAAFPELLAQASGDIDVDLRTIYDSLVAAAGRHVDLYQEPYREKWDPKALVSTTYKPDPWTRFMSWAAKIAAAYDLEKEERSYKLEMARRLDEVRPAVTAGTAGWTSSLRSALNYGNLLDSFFKVALFNALEAHPDRSGEILKRFWRDDPDPQLMTPLHSELKEVMVKGVTPGNATALGSVLLMSRDNSQYPPYRPTPVEKARALTQHAATGTAPSERYDDLLTMCDEVLERAADHALELQDRLDAQGLIWAVVTYPIPESWPEAERAAFATWRGEPISTEPASSGKKAWLVRGSSVNGRDLVPVWLQRGSASLAASKLRAVDTGLEREDLKPIIDEDYAQASYAAKAAKVDEFHAFLTRMQVGDLITTTSQGRLYVGTITGDPTYISSEDGRSNLRRPVDWTLAEGIDYADVPSDVSARLQVQHEVVEMTQQLEQLEAMLAKPAVAAIPTPEPPVELSLPDATDEIAQKLNIDRAWLQESIQLLRDRKQLIYYGPPGTGKTYVALRLAEHLAGDHVRLVQFHPAYTYEDFFEGYRPVPSGGFALRPGPLRKIVDQAKDNPSTPYFLIIDEINRGNLAKIFGELYFLLEYRDREIDLLYATDDDVGFTLPKNVFIIGTMNTADRSIALVDSAMRRRFAFEALHPSVEPTASLLRSWLKAENLPGEVADLLDALNARIDDTDFKIGPSYFMKPGGQTPEGIERTWRTSILPLLEEHHYGELSSDEIASRYGLSTISARVSPSVQATPPVSNSQAADLPGAGAVAPGDLDALDPD